MGKALEWEYAAYRQARLRLEVERRQVGDRQQDYYADW